MIQDILSLLHTRWDFFLGLTLEHLKISGAAIIFASVAGVILGVLCSEHERVSRFVTATSNVIYTIPAISMLGFLIPVTGIGNGTAIVALSVYGLLPMIGSTNTGLRTIDPDVVEAARGMGSSRRQMLYAIKIPLALPVILTGMRTMVVMTIALAGIASFIGAGGLGVAVYRGITTNNTAMTVAGSALIALIAVLFDGLFAFLARKIPWNKERA